MRINEITSAQDKVDLLRLIDAAIWHAFDAERFYADNETEAEQGVAATPTANQVAPKPAAMQKPTRQLKNSPNSSKHTLKH